MCRYRLLFQIIMPLLRLPVILCQDKVLPMKRPSDLCRTERKFVSLLRTPLWLPRSVSVFALCLGVCLLAGCGQEPARDTEQPAPEQPKAAETKPSVKPEQAARPRAASVKARATKTAESTSVANRMLRTREKMKHILLGLMEYYDNHNMFCPDTTHPEYYAPSGRPHLSWRVHILPLMGKEELYQQFKLDEPWDSPHNQRLLSKMPDVYRAPGDPDDSTTTRFRHVESVVDAPDDRPLTMFPVTPGGKSIGFPEMVDQMSETILFLQASPEQATPWTRPDGIPLNQDNPVQAIGLSDPTGTLICFVDGHSSLVKPGTAPEIWSQLLDYADGHAIPENIFAQFPAPVLEPRTNVPLHLAYLEPPFMNGILVLRPRDIIQTSQSAAMLEQLGKAGLLPLQDRWEKLETVVVWLRRRGAEYSYHFLVRLTEPLSREAVLKTYGFQPESLWQHDERTWLIAPEDFVKRVITMRELSADEQRAWVEMDLSKQLAMRYFLVTGDGDWPALKMLVETLHCELLRKVFLVDLTVDFSGDSELAARLFTSGPDVAAELQKQIQQFADGETASASAVGKRLSESLKQNLSTSLSEFKELPDRGNILLNLKWKHFDQDADFVPLFNDKLIQPAIAATRSKQRELEQKNRMKMLGLAFHNFHDFTGHLPPAPDNLVDGKPLLSWRVQLLPYLGEGELYEKFQQNEAWDSPHNLKLLDQMPEAYKSAGVTRPGYTSIMTFSGKRTPFDRMPGRSLNDIPDGIANTIMCVQAGADQAVPWTKPVDLPFDSADPIRSLGTLEEDLFIACMMDGSVRWFYAKMPTSELRKFIDPNDGEYSLLGKVNPRMNRWDSPAEWALIATLNLQASNSRDRVLSQLAVALAVSGQTDQALEVAGEIELLHLKGSTLGEIAAELARSGDLQQAMSVVRSIKNVSGHLDLLEAKQASSEVMPLCRIARVQSEKGDRALALATIRQATDQLQKIESLDLFQVMKEYENRCEIAEALLAVGEKKVALELLQESGEATQRIDPPIVRAIQLARLAPLVARAGNATEARKLITKALQLSGSPPTPNQVRVLEGCGLAYLELGDKKQAFALVGQALNEIQKLGHQKLKEIFLDAIFQVMLKADDLEQTETEIRKVTDSDSRAILLSKLSIALLAAGKKQQAEKLLRQATVAAVKESHGVALLNLAAAYAAAGESEEAWSTFDRAVQAAELQGDLVDCIVQLSIEPLPGVKQAQGKAQPVIRIRKTFTAKQYALAKQILEMVRE